MCRRAAFTLHGAAPTFISMEADEGQSIMATVTENERSRRDILAIAAGTFGVAGLAAAVWPLIAQMEPDASTRAASMTEVDLAPIAEGQIVTVKWQGKPVFVRHRTAREIDAARATPMSALSDPATDASRTLRPEWLIVVGICTHLGCVPIGHEGRYDGWFCPCHGSVYDTAGRVRRGPALSNLLVPPYAYTAADKVLIG